MTVYCEYVGKDIPPCPDSCKAPNIFYCIVNTRKEHRFTDGPSEQMQKEAEG